MPFKDFSGGGDGAGYITIADTGDPYADMCTLQATAGAADGDWAYLEGVDGWQEWHASLNRWYPFIPHKPNTIHTPIADFVERITLDGATDPVSESPAWNRNFAGTSYELHNCFAFFKLSGFSAGASVHTLTVNGTDYTATNEATEADAIDAIKTAAEAGEASVTITRRAAITGANYVNADVSGSGVSSLAAGAGVTLSGYDGEAWLRTVGGATNWAKFEKAASTWVSGSYSCLASGHLMYRAESSAVTYIGQFGYASASLIGYRGVSSQYLAVLTNARNVNDSISAAYGAKVMTPVYVQCVLMNNSSATPYHMLFVDGQLTSDYSTASSGTGGTFLIGQVAGYNVETWWRDWSFGTNE